MAENALHMKALHGEIDKLKKRELKCSKQQQTIIQDLATNSVKEKISNENK